MLRTPILSWIVEVYTELYTTFLETYTIRVSGRSKSLKIVKASASEYVTFCWLSSQHLVLVFEVCNKKHEPYRQRTAYSERFGRPLVHISNS